MNWLQKSLFAAGIYNIIFGAWTVIFPNSYFIYAGMEPPLYPQLWQCIGMIVGVYGLGYLVAAKDPDRHWPIVMVGFLGKIFGPIGFLQAIFMGTLPLKFGTIIIFNDLVWWIPFFLLLKGAYEKHKA
jgi:hypothetical protein